MVKSNISEYEFIRREMDSLRDCITTYLSFTMGGAGLVLFGSIVLTPKDKFSEANIILLFILSLIFSLVLWIIYYKFNSYNRYTGYCKLLNQEYFKINIPAGQEYSWEICMDVLREFDDNKTLMNNMVNNIKEKSINNLDTIKSTIRNIYEKKYNLNEIYYGFIYVFMTIFWKKKTKSWKYPLYVTSVFFILIILFIGAGFGIPLILDTPINWAIIKPAGFSIIVVQLAIWCRLFNMIYELMDGKRSIESYCLRFLPIRYNYIKEIKKLNKNKSINYTLITLKNKFKDPVTGKL